MCDETVFIPQLTQAAWPPDPFHESFYNDYIQDWPYEFRYDSVRNIIHSQNSTVENIDYHNALLGVERNFLHADIYLGSMTYVEYTEKEKTTWASYLSQLGGALNLFAGITIVILIELLEFIIRIFTGKEKNIEVPQGASTARIGDASNINKGIGGLSKGLGGISKISEGLGDVSI